MVEIRRVTDKSHNILEFMAKTVDTFGHLLNTSNKPSRFFPKTIIKEILYLVRDTFKFHKTSITYAVHDDIQLNGNPTELAHAILSILNNIRDIIQEHDVISPHVLIKAYEDSGNYCIEISDNAGGIKVRPISKIFNLGFSNTKTDNSGIGLYITKEIIENRFNGTIDAENIDDGALFKITIPCSGDENKKAKWSQTFSE